MVGAVVVVVILGVAAFGTLVVVRELGRRDLPTPEFPSLAETPDPALHGTVAFISEAKNPAVKERRACARVAVASGAAAKDAYCWEIEASALATAVWRTDGRLLVTSFEDPVGDPPVRPVWAKTVDVTTGATEDVPTADLGKGARPSARPVVNADGERVIMESGSGDAHLVVSGPAGSRTVLKVTDANPDWSLQSGPVWSPDSAWIMTWDGRLLITTAGDTPTTSVLAQEASWSPYGNETPNFSIRGGDVPLS